MGATRGTILITAASGADFSVEEMEKMKAKKSPESTVSGCEFLKRDSSVSGKWRRKLLCFGVWMWACRNGRGQM